MFDPVPVKEWLVSSECRQLSIEPLFDSLGNRLVAAGLRLWRIRSTIVGMHPEVYGRVPRWTRGQGVDVAVATVKLFSTPSYIGSPVEALREGAPRVRVDLRQANVRYAQLEELKAEGGTDYIAFSVVFGPGRRSFISFATDHADGFSDAELAGLESLLEPLSLRFELESARFSSETLLQLYLGANAARRVLGGDFRRGTGQIIPAAIWLCDLRGFTALVDQKPLGAVVPILDSYFESMAGPLNEEGGEILKFIGDSILAVFPIAEDEAKACRNAVKSASNAIRHFEQSDIAREHGLRVGVAVNLGQVMYGNIGAANRLDFTVIGAAVNEASRMESLCKALKTPLVISENVARHLDATTLVPLGGHLLRGVTSDRSLFTLEAFRPG